MNDPWDGSTTARLDAILTKLPANTPTTVHLGPGIFRTAGYTDDPGVTPGWEIKPGMRIVGSGMDVTTLRLDFVSFAGPAHHFAVGHRLVIGTPITFNPVDYCEVSDLTVDCNLAGHSSNFAAGAVRLMGNHVRVRRVKAINWGTLTTGKACFVRQLVSAHTDATAGRLEVEDIVIENCIATAPSNEITNVAGITTLFRVGAKDDLTSQMEGDGLAPVIRDCYADGTTEEFPPLEPQIRALSMGSCRGGVVEGNQIQNVQIGGPYQENTTTLDIVVRGNTYKNVIRGPWWNLGQFGTSLSITGFQIIGAPPSSVIEATCTGHSLAKGERVRISGASQAPMNGVFVVSAVPASNKFQYVMESNLSAVPGTGTLQKVYGAGSILVENNVIELAPTGAATAIQLGDNAVGTTLGLNQGPDYTYGEVILRGNTVRYLNSEIDGTGGSGADLAGITDATIRDQVLEVVSADGILLKDFRCRNVTYLKNQSAAGDLVQGYNGMGNYKYGELETEAEDALVFTLW